MWLLEGGEVLCPASGLRGRMDVRVAGDHIAEVGPRLRADGAGRIDCSGAVIVPAFVDLASEFCDPGGTWREDLESASRAAAAGGFAVVVGSPRTDPVVDTASVAADVLCRAAQVSGAELWLAGALTVGLQGAELAEMNDLCEAGCVAFSDGGQVMADTLVFRHALEYARPLGLPVLLRPGDRGLEERGCMHEGAVSMRIGLHGIPAEAEELGIARALALARLAGVRLHLTHVTTARGVELVRRARAEGQRVTAAVPARHLVLSDEDVDRSGYDPNLRLVPPLRPPADRAALLAAVKGADLDVVSADHVPLTRVEKEHEFSAAAPGGTGLETAFSAALTALGDLAVAVRALAVAPGRILGLDPRIAPGARAHLAIVEPGAEQVVGPPRESRGCNEPLVGRRLRGRVRATLVGGRLACGAVRGVIA